MPSGHSVGGGHSGGGGFSFGGSGFRSSGYSHVGGARGMQRGRRNGRTVVFMHFGGRRYYAASWVGVLGSLFSILLFIGLIAIFFTVSSFFEQRKIVEGMVTDHGRYQDMIAFAEANPEYVTYGVITEYGKADGSEEYYYLRYSFGPSGKIKGFTYSIYTIEDLNKPEYKKGESIKLAIDTKASNLENMVKNLGVNGIDVDSVPFDYKGKSLEDDCDYVWAVKKVGAYRTGMIVSLAVPAVVILLSLLLFKTAMHKDTPQHVAASTEERLSALGVNPNSMQSNYASEDTDEFIEEQPDKFEKGPERYSQCEYCGGRISSSASRCPNCGAKLK